MFGFHKKILSLKLNINGSDCEISVFKNSKGYFAKAWSNGDFLGEGRGNSPTSAVENLKKNIG